MRRTFAPLCLSAVLAIAPVDAQIVWQKSSANPVMPRFSADANDANAIDLAYEPCVLPPDSQGFYRMYFGSATIWLNRGGNISTAVSPDGEHWYPYVKNPVLRPSESTAFDHAWIYSADVIRSGSTYMMYYCAINEGGGNIAIGLATSSDGITWQKYSGNPILEHGSPGSWEAEFVDYPRVLFDGETYHMWYTGNNGSVNQVGYASSEDGFNWTKYAGNPVLSPSASGRWDGESVAVTGVTRHDSLLYMVFMGSEVLPADWTRYGLAVSTDGITWTREVTNPLLGIGSQGQWDDRQLGGGCLRFVDGKFALWYSASSYDTPAWEIGLATSIPGPASVGLRPGAIPEGFALGQSYPNPFNPRVTVEFSVPREEFVTITVFDGLGREVATLVEERTGPGRYSVAWDATNVASGKYWYRMMAGTFSDTKSMVLLK